MAPSCDLPVLHHSGQYPQPDNIFRINEMAMMRN
jgi:hypothetical protein